MSADCWCYECETARLANLSGIFRSMARRFITCPECGNKRCPRATDHQLACTKSNEPGQPGSRYA